jgi:MYXO-CTERM domain-containing protein
MRKLALLTLFTLLLIPGLAKAEDNNSEDHRKVSATEMVTGGVAAAGLLGVAGYLFLRRRTARAPK